MSSLCIGAFLAQSYADVIVKIKFKSLLPRVLFCKSTSHVLVPIFLPQSHDSPKLLLHSLILTAMNVVSIDTRILICSDWLTTMLN
ncbi:hypothetical protein LXL04_000089 [Taraxacum kok-saghyz]